MYGGVSNLSAGRGGGGSRVGGKGTGPHNKRSSFPPPPRPNRPAFRPSLGGGGASSNPRGGTIHTSPVLANGTTSTSNMDENFSLVTGKNSNVFAVMVKMAPGLVDELNKVEAMGEVPRIKFDSSGANATGNVIEVGGKEFKFTWSPEIPQLCDIYEEQQGGEDGGSVLVRSGSCLRKVNVQRILDESTTNHVKMRSEEAERQLKSRKAIVLDHSSPSMKNQLKQIAAVETNLRKGFKQKNDLPFKKQKTEAPIKSTLASATTSTVAKSARSFSPSPSSPGSKSKDQSRNDLPSQNKKDSFVNLHRENTFKSSTLLKGKSTTTQNGSSTLSDFRNALITLLKDTPNGISYKDLEKGLSDDFPNFVSTMEAALKKVASFHSGRYFVKPGIENGRSLEDPSKKMHQEDREGPDTWHAMSDDGNNFRTSPDQEQTHLESTEAEDQRNSPNMEATKRVLETNEAISGSSNDSGSDSDSDSGSESESHNQSKSPMKSESASSGGDSDSDASCNSKEGSDVDVDIMKSDDENESQLLKMASQLVDQSSVTGNETFEADTALIEKVNITNDAEKSFVDHEMLTRHLFGTDEPHEACDTPEQNLKTTTKRPVEDSHGEKQKTKKILESDNAGKRRQFNGSPYREHIQINDPKSAEKPSQMRRGFEVPPNLRDRKVINNAMKENQIPVTKSLQRDLSDLEQGELRETEDNPMDLDIGLQNDVKKPSPSPASAEMKISGELHLTNMPRSNQKSSLQISNGKLQHNESTFKKERKDKKLPSRFTKVRKSNGKSESSAEEESSSFYKYEKETPELKGPIKEYTQYKDYVQEYREKYDCYCELNKILEGYRDEFQKLGKELESVEGKDPERYNKLCLQLKDSYNRCRPRHKRLKKIFIVLHEELKTLKVRIKDYAAS